MEGRSSTPLGIGISVDSPHRLAPPTLRRLGRAAAESDVFYPNRRRRRVSGGEAYPGLSLHPAGIIKAGLTPLDSEAIIGRNHKSRRVAAGDEVNLRRPLRESIRYSWPLRRIFRGIGVNHVQPAGRHQPEELTSLVETEAGMKLGTGGGPVLPRCEDQQVLPRQQLDGGKEPLPQVARVIAKTPAIEINRRRSLVLDLDPIR